MLIVGKASIFFGRSVNVQFKPETVTLYYNDAHIKSAITSMLIPSKIFKFANNSKIATFLNKTLLSSMN